MSTKHADLFAALAAPFDPSEVKVRTQAGRQFHYVTARTVMNRLDSVLGPEGWWDDYAPHESSVFCRLTIRLPDGSWLTKCDAGGYAGMADQGDDDKSGYSDAFKRAAVKFGVARYLYRDGVPDFAGGEQAAPPSHQAPAPSGNGQHDDSRDLPHEPRSGKGIFAAVKDLEQKHSVAILRPLSQWAKGNGWADRMVDWDNTQVHEAWGWVSERVAEIEGNGSEPAPKPAPKLAPAANGTDELPALRQRLYAAVKACAARVYGQPEPNITFIARELQVVADLYSPGLVVESIKALDDPAEIAGLIEAAARRLKDVSECPL